MGDTINHYILYQQRNIKRLDNCCSGRRFGGTITKCILFGSVHYADFEINVSVTISSINMQI